MSGFNDPVVGGSGILKRGSIQSPNFVAGISGWSVNKDGSAQFNQLTLIVQSSGAAVLVYAGSAQAGTLIGSWANVAGTDSYGNTYPAGLSVSSGFLQGVQIQNAQILGSTLLNAVLQGPSLTQAAITGGSITETTITFDSVGGGLLVYTSTTTTVTQTVNGDYTITFPSTVSAAKVECIGAGAGAGGGNPSTGGETGGGGEYACEPAYQIIGGNTYSYTVGNGGNGGITNQAGSDGTDSFFDFGGVIANGGTAGSGGIKGKGGTGSTNTIHHNGGDGADGGSSTGGSSGGNSATPTAAGNAGIKATTSSGAARPTAQSGGGQGGAGGANGANGSNGGAPGAAGGGAGSGSSANTITKNYQASSSRSWYGADGSSPNQTRGTNGTMYQGGESAGGGSFNGTQKSACLFPSSTIQADFAGATMTGGKFFLTNQHSWYNNGLSVQVKEWPSSLGTSLPSSWDGLGAPLIATPFVSEGSRFTQSFSASIATKFANGTDRGIAIGPGPGSLNLNYYGYFNGTPNNASGPVLQLTGTVGTGSNTAGSGNDGQVSITYITSSVLGLAIAPVAGSDANGNAFAAGLTGIVTAFQPNSSPTVVEVWNSVTPPSGWSGTVKYKKLAESDVAMVEIHCTHAGASGNVTFVTLPAAYIPSPYGSVTRRFPLAIKSNTAPANSNQTIDLNSSGAVTTFALPASTTEVHASIVYRLSG